MGCHASVLMNHCISTLQHCHANSCDRLAGEGHIKELHFSNFTIPHSFCQVTHSAAVDCSISLNIAKLFMVVPNCFSATRNSYYSTLFVMTITGRLHFEEMQHRCHLLVSLQICTKNEGSSNLYYLK